MKYIEITRAEAHDRYEKGEKVYAMPCKLTPFGYWGSPLTLDKAKFDELGARFDEVIRAYMVVNCNKVIGEKLKFYRAEKNFLITRRGVPLSEFAPNDLPTRISNVIKFSRNSFYTFSKSEEAQEFIDYILRKINENAERYGKEKTEKLIGIVNSLEIEED